MQARQLITYDEEDYPQPKTEDYQEQKPTGLAVRKLSPFKRFKIKQRRVVSQRRGQTELGRKSRDTTPKHSGLEPIQLDNQVVTTGRRTKLIAGHATLASGHNEGLVLDSFPGESTGQTYQTKGHDFEPDLPYASHDSEDSLVELKQQLQHMQKETSTQLQTMIVTAHEKRRAEKKQRKAHQRVLPV